MKQPMTVVITGAAGNIAYSMIYRIANGEMLGKDQPVHLKLLDIEPSMNAVNGVVMEIDDCAFPLVQSITASHDPMIAFKDADIAMFVGAKPRGKGMERKDLIGDNGKIFAAQGKALDAVAKKDVKVIVVGNPANTNAMILAHNAPSIPAKNITSMMRLDHNRILTQVATKLGVHNQDVKNVTAWGNHSSTQYPDIFHAKINGKLIHNQLEESWLVNDFIPVVQKRGAAIIEARGLSSAASAAHAAIEHIRNWVLGTPEGDWVSMGIKSNGEYGVPKGLFFGFPVTCKNGEYKIVEGLEINDFSQAYINKTIAELEEEKATVAHLMA